MQKVCYVLSGVSGAGKSTAIKLLSQKFLGNKVIVFSLDTCRLTLLDKNTESNHACERDAYADAFRYANENPDIFNKHVDMVWKQSLANADVLFVDNTNISRKARARWINSARQAGFLIIGVELMVPLQVAIERQSTRTDKSVPEHVVRNMYMSQQSFLLGSEVDSLIFVDGCHDSIRATSTLNVE